ncbi:polysaccharide biosynthesis/export family protein [Pseudomonas aeruginosa]
MKRTLLMLAMLALAACNTPARIPAPDSDTVDSGKRALEELARLPPAMERVRVGDTLRIVRDAGEMPTLSAFNVATIYELTLYTVLNDGSIYYPFIGRIQAAHRTPQEIANELTTKLAPIYREPRVTVNINQAPGNTVFVGGAVRNPSAVPIPPRTRPDAELWITMEGWDGSMHQASIPLAEASPATVAWLNKRGKQ